MAPRDLEDRLRDVAWPGPSAGLRDRVLTSVVISPEPMSWSDRMWFSRTWRRAALAAVVVVVVVEQMSFSSMPVNFTASRTNPDVRMVEDTAREMGLPPAVVTWLGRRSSFEAARMQSPADSVSAAVRTLDQLEGGGVQ